MIYNSFTSDSSKANSETIVWMSVENNSVFKKITCTARCRISRAFLKSYSLAPVFLSPTWSCK